LAKTPKIINIGFSVVQGDHLLLTILKAVIFRCKNFVCVGIPTFKWSFWD
jgi:hypothetical protein